MPILGFPSGPVLEHLCEHLVAGYSLGTTRLSHCFLQGLVSAIEPGLSIGTEAVCSLVRSY